jgi:hypothetical protein
LILHSGGFIWRFQAPFNFRVPPGGAKTPKKFPRANRVAPPWARTRKRNRIEPEANAEAKLKGAKSRKKSPEIR